MSSRRKAKRAKNRQQNQARPALTAPGQTHQTAAANTNGVAAGSQLSEAAESPARTSGIMAIVPADPVAVATVAAPHDEPITAVPPAAVLAFPRAMDEEPSASGPTPVVSAESEHFSDIDLDFFRRAEDLYVVAAPETWDDLDR